MITTKIKNIITAIGLLTMVIVSIISCSSDDQEPNNNQKNITLADFEKVGKVYMESDPELKKSKIGKTPEMAMTPIMFREDGSLYRRNDADTRRILEGDRKSIQAYYTDLQTFAKVTADPYATIEYVECIGVNPESGICLYDSYDPEPHKVEDSRNNNKEVNSRRVTSSLLLNSSPFRKGDMITGKWENGNPYGHIAIVYKESNKKNALLNQYIKSTTTFDAWSDKVPIAEQVGPRNMSEYWLSSQTRNRTLLRFRRYGPYINNGLTSTEISKILAYLEKQQGKSYEITLNVNDESCWYCSKLVYKAYLAAGIKLIDPGWYILPADIRGSSYIVQIPF